MTLCDTGPLVALIDRHDTEHVRSAELLRQLGPMDLVTTWECVTEAMYFLQRAGGFAAQDEFWQILEEGAVRVHELGTDARKKMRLLMQKCADAPMDFADASLVAAAEMLRSRRVFTLDHHFRAYRVEGDYFDVVP